VFARTSTWTGTPEALDKWAAGVATVRPFVEGLDGNAGVFFLIDRSGLRALTLTLWHTDDAARASDVAADESRARTIAATGVDLVGSGQYEVVDRPDAT
jgi:heme-degrading monooxygenase HmoA